MALTLLAALRAAVRRYELLRTGDVVLVAVSGGADSVALLAALHELRDELGIRLVAAHLDHGLRGAESAADRTFVEALAAELGVPLTVEAVRLPPGNVEAQARHARYEFLARAAAASGATKIATAHTVDDQAETVLLRVVRGAGRRGLGGIRPRRGAIIRPLLLCDRVQVRHFLVARGRAWRRDRSNFDYGLARTRLRAGYLPALARELNPRLARALARLADVLRDEDTLLDGIAATVPGVADGIDLAVLRALEPPIARRVVRRWWRRVGSGRRLAFGHVDAALALAQRAHGGGRVRVPGGWVVRTATALAYEVGDGDAAAEPYQRVLVPGGAVDLPGGWRLSLCENVADGSITPGDDLCVLDADAVSGPLVVRTRRPGDRMRLLGLDGHTSIKRLFITRRVPQALRAGYPLVLDGNAIVWVPRCGRGEGALVAAGTRRVLVLRLEAAPYAAHNA
ncbi:MAG: tRNA lysidine(34) synthetase TilS [Deltaproteobacteria bacterium]|nr:tRNA lysidine(34) synthetase TilS [Deltaproteobacteria bacterium]